MYKHKHGGVATIGITDDEGNYHPIVPGKIITLNRIYTEYEDYGLVCINKETEQEQKEPDKIEKRHKRR